jgi:hypothetical protein
MALIPTFPAGGVTLKLTAEEARREAIGKAIGLLGTVIGVTGTLIAMSVNPAMKDQTKDLYSKLPQTVKDNKTLYLIGGGLLAAFIAYRWIGKGVQKQTLGRYA